MALAWADGDEESERPRGNAHANTTLCPHLLLKRRLISVQIISADGESMLVHPSRRLRARLCDSRPPVAVAVGLATAALGVPVSAASKWAELRLALGWLPAAAVARTRDHRHTLLRT